MKYVLYFYILLKSIIWCTYFCMLRSILGIHDECFNYPSPNKQQYKYKCTKSKTQTRSVTDICCWYHHYGMEIITSILFVDITTTVWRLLPVSCLLPVKEIIRLTGHRRPHLSNCCWFWPGLGYHLHGLWYTIQLIEVISIL